MLTGNTRRPRTVVSVLVLAVSAAVAPLANWSTGSAATGTPQTITFPAIADRTMLDPGLTLVASASSGLPVTFQSKTLAVCTITNGVAAPAVPGVCTIEADQAGDATFAAASPVTRSFTVTKAPQTITFPALPDVTLTLGIVFASATATSGHAVTFSTTTPTVCSVGSGAGEIDLHVAGTCTVNADQAGTGTFAAAPTVTRSFLVNKTAQAITFATIPDHSVLDPPFSVSASASSLLPVTFSVPATTAVCTASNVNGTTITLVTAGTCTVEADQAGNDSFSAAPPVTRSFNVARAPQTITFGALATRTVAQSPFAVAARASSGLAVTFSTTTPSVCTVNGVNVTLLTAGTCTIEALQGGNAAFAPADAVLQSLAVTKADQTITFTEPPGVAVGSSVTAAAVASSGLVVTFSSTTPLACSATGANGAIITRLTTAACTVQADQPGNAGYNAAPPVTRTLGLPKSSQTITFPPIANTTLARSPVVVHATASSNLTVVFTTTTPAVCTAGGVNGSQVTLHGGGTCTVRAAQPGNTDFAAAAPVTRSFNVASPVGTSSQPGYWMLGSDGRVYAFGSATDFGSSAEPAVAFAARRDGAGYWLVDQAGVVHAFGRAVFFGGHPDLLPGEHVSTISATPTGSGYWLFSTAGRVFAFGDARFFGDLRAVHLNGPIVASVATPTGRGYYMVASDGGVFSFGDAHFHGSMGGAHLNRPIVGLSPTPDNRGYWLVASDGGVFAFAAPFRGSLGSISLNRPVNGIVAFGNGYLMVASDGGVFDFSDRRFVGSLGADPPSAPIVGIAAGPAH